MRVALKGRGEVGRGSQLSAISCFCRIVQLIHESVLAVISPAQRLHLHMSSLLGIFFQSHTKGIKSRLMRHPPISRWLFNEESNGLETKTLFGVGLGQPGAVWLAGDRKKITSNLCCMRQTFFFPFVFQGSEVGQRIV